MRDTLLHRFSLDMKWKMQKVWPSVLMVQVIVVSTTIPAMFTLLLRITLHLKAVQSNKSPKLLEFNHLGMNLMKRLLQTGRTLLKILSTSTMRVLLESALKIFLNLLILWSNLLEWILIIVQKRKKMPVCLRIWRLGLLNSIWKKKYWICHWRKL